MPEPDWTWHIVWDSGDPNSDTIILSDDSPEGSIRLEIRAPGFRSAAQGNVDELRRLAGDAISKLQDALASPSRLRKRSEPRPSDPI